MAKYNINYVCGHGSFDKKLFGNHAERDKYIDWAKRTMLCKDCYKAQQQKIDDEAEKIAKVYFAECFDKNLAAILVIRLSGQIEKNKETLKKDGFRWITGESENPIKNIITGGERFFGKKVELNLTDIENDLKGYIDILLKTITKLGYKVNFKFNDLQFSIIVEKIKKLADEKDRLAAFKIANPLPKKPNCWPEGEWNKKIYGNNKYGFRIFLNGKETKLKKEEAQELKDYNLLYQKWLETKENFIKEIN